MKYLVLISVWGLLLLPPLYNLNADESSADDIKSNHDDYLPVADVELERYLGKWYEVARIDQPFQKGCTASIASYEMRDDGDIKVINTCRIGHPKGKLKVARARAWVTDNVTNAKLKVQFILRGLRIPFLAGDYWIIDVGDNYEYAIVGDPSRKYLWFLSRQKHISDELYHELVARAQDLHFDTSKLIRTPQ